LSPDCDDERMLVLLSDTHGQSDHRLTDSLRELVASASLVVHAGDFTTPDVLDAFEDLADEFVAVAGNSDSHELQQRLPETQTVTFAGKRIVVTHGHRRDETGLSLLARQEGAAVVVVGHTHRAGVERVGEVAVVNPGSHADPRGGQATVAVLSEEGDDLQLRFRTRRGMTRETVVL
jgi:putative phosphoesterase